MNNKSEEIIILADGLFPQKEGLRARISQCKIIICCDGAAQKLLDFGVTPDYIVGDLDSLSPVLKNQFHDRLIRIPDQDSNDLTKAILFCISKNWKKVTILGATGLREDHTIANIALLHHYMHLGVDVSMISDYGIFTPIVKSQNFDSFKGQQVSIFVLTPDTLLSTSGLVYALNENTLPIWWQGTLNESEGDHFSIQINNEGKVIVYQVF